MTYTDQEIHDWHTAAYRPNGQHEAAHQLRFATPHPIVVAARHDAVIAQIGRPLAGADTILDALNLLPAGLDTYSSYVDNFRGFAQLVAMRGRLNPNAVYFSYTIFGNRAHCADIEQGAMHPSDVPHFLDHLAVPIPGALHPAMCYYSAGIANEVIAAAGGRPFIRMSAHFGAGPHICEPAVCGFPFAHGTQWDDKGAHGENFDRELWRPGVLRPIGPPPVPTPPKPPGGTVSVTAAVNPDGRIEVFAHLADGSVKHTWQHTPGGKWIGEVDNNGKDVPNGEASWHPLGAPGK